MIRILLLSILLWSCAQHKKSLAPENSVSMIMFSDSVIIYSGKLKKNTAYQEIANDEVKVKSILAKEKVNASKELIVLLKLSGGVIRDGFMWQIKSLKNWTVESGITDIRFAEMDEMDLSVFKLQPVPWALIDSFNRPLELDLAMPKDTPGETPEPIKITIPKSASAKNLPDDNAFYIEIRDDNSVWYQPRSLITRMAPQKVNEPVNDKLKRIISDYKNANADKEITYFIKGHPNATYPVVEQVIKALKTNNISNYKLVTSEE